jgi:transketolase
MQAGGRRLASLCVVLDLNCMQVAGHIDKVIDMHPIADKWTSFGFRVDEIDGNDMGAVVAALDRARACTDRPTCILARTLVGKGVPELEGILAHNIKLSRDLADRSLLALGEAS